MTYPTPKKSQSQSGPALTFGALRAIAAEQIDLDLFDPEYKPIAEAIALMIAEINSLPETATARIGGGYVPVPVVREIFASLHHDHVLNVIRKYSALRYTVTRPKTYIRTALYNAVFELDAAAANAYGKDHQE